MRIIDADALKAAAQETLDISTTTFKEDMKMKNAIKMTKETRNMNDERSLKRWPADNGIDKENQATHELKNDRIDLARFNTDDCNATETNRIEISIKE